MENESSSCFGRPRRLLGPPAPWPGTDGLGVIGLPSSAGGRPNLSLPRQENRMAASSSRHPGDLALETHTRVSSLQGLLQVCLHGYRSARKEWAVAALAYPKRFWCRAAARPGGRSESSVTRCSFAPAPSAFPPGPIPPAGSVVSYRSEDLA